MTEILDRYDLVLLVIGLAAFGVVGLPRVLADRPLSYPIIYVVGGVLFFALPFGFEAPDPIRFSDATERLTEIGVIVALMGAGIGISRPFGWRRCPAGRLERRAIAFSGIRGVGSFYYLSYAANQVGFWSVDRLWAIVSLVVVVSIVLHGVTASPAMRRLDEIRAARG